MHDSPVETTKFMCENIWCMLDWIVALAETLPWHVVAQLVSAQNEMLL